MRFTLPHDQSEFDIPDAWWEASGAASFVLSTPAFAAQPGVTKLWDHYTSQSEQTIQSKHCPTQLIALLYVAPPKRDPGAGWFEAVRMIRILQAMCTEIALPPIEVWRGVPGDARLIPRDGFHRFYASVALGFPMLPVAVFRYVP